MTPAEHAERLHRTAKALDRAHKAHHEALAAFARDCGEELGVEPEIIAAAAPKDPPPNP